RIPSDQPGARRYERPLSLQPRFTLVRMYAFAGGCVTYRFSFISGAAPSLGIPIDTAVAFQSRSVLAGYVQRTEKLARCGRGAPCRGWAPDQAPGGGRRCPLVTGEYWGGAGAGRGRRSGRAASRR